MIAALAAAGVAYAQMPGVMDLMKATVIPDSTVVFEVGNKAPASDAQWAAVQKSATALVDAAKKLEALAPADNAAPWQKFAREMGDAAAKSLAAAKARNADAVQDAGDALYETCAGCHKIFLKR
jgi:hypothetical protein